MANPVTMLRPRHRKYSQATAAQRAADPRLDRLITMRDTELAVREQLEAAVEAARELDWSDTMEGYQLIQNRLQHSADCGEESIRIALRYAPDSD